MAIHRVLTDNGKEFTDRLFGLRKRAPTGKHEFDRLCAELDIEHRLSPPMHPQTNGMVERFNGRIEDVLQSHHFHSDEEIEITLHRYVWLYNQELPQSVLASKTPVQAMKDWYKIKPELFKKKPYYLPGCDSLLDSHLSEMMPIIYTPTVGEACEHFSDIYRRARGLFISYPNQNRIDDMLQNATKQNVKVIVVTDGERILGLGDQGIGGMGIPIGKLSLYTACGGISPAYTLPVVLDVGTNNPQRLNDPLYMGWRHPRISGDEYHAFVEAFIQAVKRRWPNALLQFEDFAQSNATPLLNRYRDEICCFNDDIQGTAAVTLGSLIAASHAAGSQLRTQTVTFLGAGSAGCGIAEQIIAQMKSEGLSEDEARARIFMVDRFGLLTDKPPNLLEFQSKLVQKHENLTTWQTESKAISLLDVVRNAKPTILIGVSGQPGLFTEELIREMHQHCARPIVMPLSNPTSRVEARPEDIINWTEGAALVATGSPFAPVTYQAQQFPIAQCNNAYIFPGIGLGVLASGATRVTDAMLMAASRALADCSPLATDGHGALLPNIDDIKGVSKCIATAVGKAAQLQGVAMVTSEDVLSKAIEHNFWRPQYRSYRAVNFFLQR